MRSNRPSPIDAAIRLARRAGLALALALSASAPAHAQLGSRTSLADAFRPDILQRDITLINSVLKLEDWQRPIVETLMQDYMTAFNTGIESLKDRMKAAQQDAARSNPSNADAMLDRIMAPLSEWRAEKRAMSDRFLTDLKSQLGPQQQELWPQFERALRRERMLPDGDLSGEGTDLWAVLARMDPSPAEEEAVKAPLAAYEVELDRALLNREREMQKTEQGMTEAMRSMDLEGMAREQEKVMVYRVAVRNLNDAAIESVAQALGDRGPDFRRRALEAGYPDVFRVHPVSVLFQQAKALEGLSDDQRSRIEALETEFAAACDQENLKLLASVRAEEPNAPRRRAEARKQRGAAGPTSAPGSGPSPDDPIVKGRIEKERMGQPFREQLMGVLTPEQQGMLPGAVKVDPAGVMRENQNRPKGGQIAGVEPGGDDPDSAGRRRAAAPPRRDPRTAPGAGGGEPAAAPDPAPAAEPAPAP